MITLSTDGKGREAITTALETALKALGKAPLPKRRFWRVRTIENYRVLINPDGKAIASFLSTTTDDELEQTVLALNAVEELLKGMYMAGRQL